MGEAKVYVHVKGRIAPNPSLSSLNVPLLKVQMDWLIKVDYYFQKVNDKMDFSPLIHEVSSRDEMYTRQVQQWKEEAVGMRVLGQRH